MVIYMVRCGDAYGDIVSYAVTESSPASAVNVGDICYMRGSTGTWNQADADATTTSISMLGVSMGNNDVLLRGFAKINPISGSDTNTHGAPVYLSAVDIGSGSFVAPTGTGDVVRVIGYPIGPGSNDIIYFNPDSTWVKVA